MPHAFWWIPGIVSVELFKVKKKYAKTSKCFENYAKVTAINCKPQVMKN